MAKSPAADLDLIKSYTKSTRARFASMVDALNSLERLNVRGDVVECGVWKGGNIMLARQLCPDRVCWLYDTFDGMTVPDGDIDVKRNGERAIDRYKLKLAGGTKWDAVSLDSVIAGFKMVGLFDPAWLRFVVGPVEDTLLRESNRPSLISILRLDVDWYLPTKVALETLWPLVSDGGCMIVDDYGHWMGCKKAVDDYFHPSRPEIIEIDYTCVVIRKC